MKRLSRTGTSLLAALALVLFPIGLGAAWLALRAPPTGPTTELRTALLRSGLGAEALAASGASAQETSAVVAAFASAMASQPGALKQADAQYAAARVTKDELERKVRSGLATQQEVADLASAKSALTSAEAARKHLLDGWFEDATANLGTAKVATLNAIQANGGWELPVEFLVKQRDQQEWVAIKKALANERIAPKYGDPPDPTQQASLATWRSDASVAAAKTASASGLASVQDAWDAATGG